jgi:hypothetical protein
MGEYVYTYTCTYSRAIVVFARFKLRNNILIKRLTSAHARLDDASRLRDLQHRVRDPPLLALLRALVLREPLRDVLPGVARDLTQRRRALDVVVCGVERRS